MKHVKFRHLLLYLFLLQLAIPIPTLVWGEPLGVLAGALIAVVLTPLAAFALSRMHRFLLRLIEEKAAQLALSARETPAGELWALPLLHMVGRAMARILGPISIILLVVYLSGILPGFFDMVFVFLQLLFLLAIILIAALASIGKANPDLLRFLANLLYQRRKRRQQPADRVIIVTDASSEQAPDSIPVEGPGVMLFQLLRRPADLQDRSGLPAAILLLLLRMPERHDGAAGLLEPPEQEGG